MILSFGLGVGVPIVKVNSQNRLKKIASRVRVVSIMVFVVLFGGSVAVAQIPASSRPAPTPPQRSLDGTIKGSDDTRPLTTIEEEFRAKRAIKLAEKEHNDNLKRAREIAQIGK